METKEGGIEYAGLFSISSRAKVYGVSERQERIRGYC